MSKRFKNIIAITGCFIVLSGGVIASAATLSPWASINNGILTNSVETTFTPSWLTVSADSQYGVASGKYIKNSWVQIVEGADVRYSISNDYYRPDTTWVHTQVSLGDNPFQTAKCSYGWGYQ